MEDDADAIELKPASMRRNFTLRNNVARQVVNFMPSRQMPYNTLRMRRINSEHNALLEASTSDAPDSADKQADIIVREMELHNRLMEDNPVSEELRREALRDLPQGLTMKRNVRAKLSASVSLRSKRRPISVFKRFKYRVSFAWKRARDRLRDFIFSIELWYEAIRNIEGHLGSAVGSYFHLVRWLFLLDLVLAVLTVCFVVVPQALHNNTLTNGGQMGFLDFVSGKGGFEDSILFYGHYHDGDISTPGPLTYNMPFAYFFTMLCVNLMFFAVLCYRTAYSYRRNFINSGGAGQAFAPKLFCGWDFGIVSPPAAALAHTALYNHLKELLNEQNKKRAETTFCIRFWQKITNVAVTVFVLAVIGGLQLGFWRLLSLKTEVAYWEICVSLVITAVLAVCPVLFNFIVRLEYYGPRTSVYVTLARTWLLDAACLTLLLVYWIRSGDECWESRVGQETWRLVVLDAAVSLVLLPAIEVARALIYRLKPSWSAPEFNIAYNSLTVIYNQALVWAGLAFCPLLAAAVAGKLLLLFYIKRECALRACRPAKMVWRAAQTQTIQYMLVTLSHFTTLFAVGSLFLRSSSTCGPFRGYDTVLSVVSEGVLQLSQRQYLRAAIQFLTRPGVIAFLLLALCVWVYYGRARARAQGSMAALLRHMLLLQARDKDFLLAAIDKVCNGEWLYSPRPEEHGEHGEHTWRYLRDVRKPSNAGYQFDASRVSHGPAPPARPPSHPGVGAGGAPPDDDGDTDSSFSWQGSGSFLNRTSQDDKWL